MDRFNCRISWPWPGYASKLGKTGGLVGERHVLPGWHGTVGACRFDTFATFMENMGTGEG
jgi:hypothetical protein